MRQMEIIFDGGKHFSTMKETTSTLLDRWKGEGKRKKLVANVEAEKRTVDQLAVGAYGR